MQQSFRYVQVSTDEVYGSLIPDAPAFTEAHAYDPHSPYAASKAASDHFLRAWGGYIRTSRYGNELFNN